MRGCTKQFEANPFLTYILNHPLNFPPNPESGFLYGFRLFFYRVKNSLSLHAQSNSKQIILNHDPLNIPPDPGSGFLSGIQLYISLCYIQVDQDNFKLELINKN